MGSDTIYGKNKINTEDFDLPSPFNKIIIRGTLDILNMFFSFHGLQNIFDISNSEVEVKMIKTASGIEKFLDYPNLRKALYTCDKKSLSMEYLYMIDNILFNDGKYHTFYDPIPIPLSDNDTDSLTSFESEIDSMHDAYKMQTYALEHKIIELEYQLQLKDKDIEILNLKLIDKDREIRITELQNKIESEWI